MKMTKNTPGVGKWMKKKFVRFVVKDVLRKE